MTNQEDMDMEPLRLAVGSHKAGSGKACAMQVVSWKNGDRVITDMPSCADPLLAMVVQHVNDHICTHRDGDLLSSPCSVQVLALAYRTPGTVLSWDDESRRRLYVRLALEESESAARPDEDARVSECRRVIQAWLDGTAKLRDVRARGAAVRAASAVPAGSAASAASAASAGYAAYAVSAGSAASAASAAYVAYASVAVASADALDRAHRLIDRFETHTGVADRRDTPNRDGA